MFKEVVQAINSLEPRPVFYSICEFRGLPLLEAGHLKSFMFQAKYGDEIFDRSN